MKRRLFWLILCLAALGLALGASVALAAKPIKVGIVDSYSGPPSTYTNDVRDGFKMVVDEVNAKGGVLGRKIEFTTRDDKFKVDLGLAAAKELIMREEVDILMGTINSATALAISDLAKAEKIPFFATFSKTDKLTGEKGHRYVFQITENTASAGKAAAVGLAKQKFAKYWIAGDDYEYGHAIAEAVWSNLKKLKPEVELLGQTWWKVGEPDFTPYITSILAAKPDAVIIATGGAGCVPFLKAAKATGFNEKVSFFMHTATELSTLKPLGLDAPEGVIGSSNYFFYYPDTPANRAFVEAFKKAYGREPKVGALYGYITGRLIVDGFNKAGAVDKEKLVNAIEGMTLDSPAGKVTLRAFDHQLLLPMFMGVTKKAPGYDFLIADQIVTVSAEDAAPSLDDIKKARGK